MTVDPLSGLNYDIIRLFLPKRTPSFFAEDFPAEVEIQNGSRLHM